MEECIFCKIIRGEVPCALLYEDDDVLSFLDIGPIQEGHALVVPKSHYPSLFALPKELGAALLQTMQNVGRAILDVTQAQGLNVVMNNFQAAGQLVPHAHWHLIPRFSGDGLQVWPQKAYSSSEAMADLANRIRDSLTE